MSDLPPDIAGAIDALVDAEHEQITKGRQDAGAWCEAAGACHQARAALDAAILKHLSGEGDTVRVPRLFDVDAEGEAWRHWTTGGRHHEGFVRCINTYVRDAALAQTGTRRTEE